MKFFNKILLICAVSIAMVGCEDYIGGDINADPNRPTAVPVFAQTPSILINLADVYGGAFSRFNCMLTQQVEGVARQWSSFNKYEGLTPNRFDAAWSNMYENVLNEIRIAKVNATETGANHYLGLLKITEAFAWLTAADVWDDIPFSEALQGAENFSPKYDSQASVYTAAMGMLDEGIALLNGPVGSLAVGGDDVFNDGDATKWIKAARAIKARAFLNQGDMAKAAEEAKASFESADDNLSFQYPDLNAAGQWYRFNRDRTGDLEFHPTMGALMMETMDTNRMNVFNPTFVTDHPYMVADFNQELITYREMQFIIAEADPTSADGHAAYLNGIKASFTRCGLGEGMYDAYVAQASVDPGMGNLTKEMVLKQKYVAMYLQPSVYNDWRRTGIPALTPVAGGAVETVPVRWNYPEDEVLFNSNAPAPASVSIYTDRVGWNR